MESLQNFFISHASADKPDYILPLATALTNRKVTFWLDSKEISWGATIPLKINEGLRNSRYVVLCLSMNFLARPWPESEMNAALSMQNANGVKRVLPLILNSKEAVLNTYPLISGLTYREFSVGVNAIADELAALANNSESNDGKLQITIESVHTGQISNLSVSPQVSVRWLTEKARIGAGLQDFADVGSFEKFRLRWILVDVKAEDKWKTLRRSEQRKIRAFVRSDTGIKVSRDDTEKLENLGVYDGIIFHMYAVEDEERPTIAYRR